MYSYIARAELPEHSSVSTVRLYATTEDTSELNRSARWAGGSPPFDTGKSALPSLQTRPTASGSHRRQPRPSGPKHLAGGGSPASLRCRVPRSRGQRRSPVTGSLPRAGEMGVPMQKPATTAPLESRMQPPHSRLLSGRSAPRVAGRRAILDRPAPSGPGQPWSVRKPPLA